MRYSWQVEKENCSRDFWVKEHTREHINVPLIIYNSNNKINKKGCHDSMSISATRLDELKIKPHGSMRGRSEDRPGKEIIISENFCGRGTL